MFVPARYAAENPREIVRNHPFAVVVTADASGLHATQTPVFFETDAPEETKLVGHIAHRNPQASGFYPGQSALLVFAGPHAYVSGAWYREQPQVPTWNYVTAQIRGSLEPIDDADGNRGVLKRVAEKLDATGGDHWALDHAPEGRVEALLPHIRSFRIAADSIDAAEKLSQTHPAGDRMRVIAGLVRRGEADDIHIARLMAERDMA